MATDPRFAKQERVESIHSGSAEGKGLAPGIELREFASARCGAQGFSTGTARFDPGAALAYHVHECSEAVTIIEGEARLLVEGRAHHLSQMDAVHLPAGVAHAVTNASTDSVMVALSAFGSAAPTREFVDDRYGTAKPVPANLEPDLPEHIIRFSQAESYELSEGARFRDLFAGRFGAVGICGGYGLFQPGASLPCHIHKFDESITIIEGEAVCLVQGQRYQLSGCDTAVVPQGRPHRFLNLSANPMAMIWVYAGSEPERTVVDPGYCAGTLTWPGPGLSGTRE